MLVLNTKVAPPSAGVAFNLLTARNLSLSKEQAQIRNTHTRACSLASAIYIRLICQEKKNKAEKLMFIQL